MSKRRPRTKKGQPSLAASARMARTGRGWAAGKGERLAYARGVGASRPEFFPRTARLSCTAEPDCSEPPVGDRAWCHRHIAAAARLGIEAPTR